MDGLISIPSTFGAKETMERLQAEVVARGMTVFARIDHAAGAAQVGMELRPTELLVFGNARAGTPLMQRHQTVGLDLPLKILVWQDVDGRVWLTYDEPGALGPRHALGADPILAKMSEALRHVSTVAGGGA